MSQMRFAYIFIIEMEYQLHVFHQILILLDRRIPWL